MEQVATRAGKVAFARRGSGPPLVLLHGGGHDHHDYDAVVPALARDFTTFAIDWPGSGGSDVPRDLTAALLYDVLEDLVDALALAPACFIGNSVGGAAAVRLAARRPNRVRGLVLVGSAGFSPPDALVRAVCRVQGVAPLLRRTRVAFAGRYLKRRTPHVEELLGRMRRSSTQPDQVAAHASLWRSFPDPASAVTTEAPQVRCPTLLVWGRHDPVSRATVEGRAARRLIPDARYVELDTGHVPFVEDPDAFLAAVARFLERCRGLPGTAA